LDEGLSFRLKGALQELGHDVDTVIDEGLEGVSDAILARRASHDGRMLFTLDKGLGNIRQYVPGSHPGIVLFRPGFVGPRTVFRFVEDFASDHDLDNYIGCLVIAEPGNIRIRRG